MSTVKVTPVSSSYSLAVRPVGAKRRIRLSSVTPSTLVLRLVLLPNTSVMPLMLVMDSSLPSIFCTGYHASREVPAVLFIQRSAAVKFLPLMFITVPLPFTFTSSSKVSRMGTRWPVR